jgi:hypothetical protein
MAEAGVVDEGYTKECGVMFALAFGFLLDLFGRVAFCVSEKLKSWFGCKLYSLLKPAGFGSFFFVDIVVVFGFFFQCRMQI